MKLLNNFNVSREDGGPRKFSFELTMSGIISLVVVGAIIVVWAFILGVLLGRGYKPENAVPELAQIMPTAESPAPVEQPEEPTVLKPEELQFMENLQGKAKEGDMIVVESNQAQPGAAAPKPAPSPGSGVQTYDLDKAQEPAVESPSAAPAPVRQLAESDMKMKKESSEAKAAPKADAKQVKTPAKTEQVEIAAEEAPKPAAKTAETKTASGARFSATYQIASFYKKDQADSMIQKLTKNGLSPSIREAEANGKRVYRIILTVTGTDQELSEAIKKTGEKGPMLLKKKPL